MSRLAIVWVLAILVLFGTLARAEDKADPVAVYKTFLAALPKDDPASITKAIEQYRAAVVPLDMDKRVKAFLEFLDFHVQVCEGVGKTMWKNPGDADKYNDTSDNELVRELHSHGLRIWGDGCDGFYVAGIPDYIPRIFSPYLPRSVQRYLEIREPETRVRYETDAVLLISYAQLAQRVADWDKYVRNYDNSPLRTEALTLRASYLRDLLFGLDNSPLDPKTEDRSDNIRIVYEDFLRANSGTYTAKFVRAQYDYLKKEGFFSKTFAGDPREIPRGRYAEVKACMDRTINLDRYWVDIESGYRAVKIK